MADSHFAESMAKTSPSCPWEHLTETFKFTNEVAYETICYVKLKKIPWKIPAKCFSDALQCEISPKVLAARCTYVKAKRTKLMKNSKTHFNMDNYLKEVGAPMLSSHPKKRKQRTSADWEINSILISPAEDIKEMSYCSLLDDYKKLEQQLVNLKHEQIATSKRHKPTTSRRPSQESLRQVKRIETWKRKYFDMKKNYARAVVSQKNVDDTRDSLKKLGSLNSSQRRYYKLKLNAKQLDEIAEVRHNDCVKKQHDLKERIVQLEDEVSHLQSQTDSSQYVIQIKDGLTYNSVVRRCIYHALEHQCPVDHVSEIIRYTVQQFTGSKLQLMPCPATVCSMAREMGVLSDIQAGQALAKSDHCTIAWDATELSGVHINEVHVAVPSEQNNRDYFTVGVAQLPGGTTSDYAEHIQETLETVAATYSGWAGDVKDTSKELERMQSHITASITDRVAVNHCVVEKIEDMNIVNSSLVELHCNVHPLDSLASKARSVLKETPVKGVMRGKDCAAVNLIQGLSKLRYKQGKGDPVAFKAFFKSRGIPLKLFPRYVGNRFHIVFHLAGIYFSKKELVGEFLAKYCSARGGLTASLLKDLQNPEILEHLRILGMFGKLLTGPWMTLFYTEKEKNLNLTKSIQLCVANLKKYIVDPSSVLKATQDVFGHSLNMDDPVLPLLFTGQLAKLDTLKDVATAFLAVCQRLLKNYLLDNFTDIDRQLSESTPTHNIQAERLMAMTDTQTRRAPNANIDFVEAKVKMRTNKSLSWLNTLSDKTDTTIKYVVGRAKRVAVEKDKKQKEVESEVVARLKKKGAKHDQAERRKVERKVSELEAQEEPVIPDQVCAICPADQEPPNIAVICDLFNNPSQAVGLNFLHTWFDQERDTDIVYNGTVNKLKKTKKCTFVVHYHVNGEDPVESDNYAMMRSQLVTDMLYDDCVCLMEE